MSMTDAEYKRLTRAEKGELLLKAFERKGPEEIYNAQLSIKYWDLGKDKSKGYKV